MRNLTPKIKELKLQVEEHSGPGCPWCHNGPVVLAGCHRVLVPCCPRDIWGEHMWFMCLFSESQLVKNQQSLRLHLQSRQLGGFLHRSGPHFLLTHQKQFSPTTWTKWTFSETLNQLFPYVFHLDESVQLDSVTHFFILLCLVRMVSARWAGTPCHPFHQVFRSYAWR